MGTSRWVKFCILLIKAVVVIGLGKFSYVPKAGEVTELLFKDTVLSNSTDMPIQYEQTTLATRGKKSKVATAKILEYNG